MLTETVEEARRIWEEMKSGGFRNLGVTAPAEASPD